MPPAPHVDEFASFPQSIPYSTHDLPMDTGFDNYDAFMLPDDIGSFFHSIDFDAPAEALGDGRRACSTDADMLGVNAAAAAAPQAAPPVPVGESGHAADPWCTAGTAEIQHLGEKEAQRRLESWMQSDLEQEQRLFSEVESLKAPDEKLAPAPEDGRPPCRDGDMAVVNAALTQPVALPLDVLRQITNNFSDDRLIGEGGYGKVYKGVLENGATVAVKRLATPELLDDVQFQNYLKLLMDLKHQNIVRLVGYCSEKSERLLCMEYMPKGSLRHHLSDETSGLDWNTRHEIIKGICSGLHYLHEECQTNPIIHMDLKPENILVDHNMIAKIEYINFSAHPCISQLPTYTTSFKKTRDYMAPEYLEKDVITKRSDIFSLGATIMEIITGRKDYPTDETGRKDYPTDETETASRQYIDLVINNWRHRPTKARGYTYQDIDYQEIKNCIQIGLLCVKFDPVKRPTTSQIIKMLERSDETYQNEREEEAHQWFDSWKSTVLQDLFPEVLQPDTHSRTSFQKFNLEELRSRLSGWERMKSRDFHSGELPDSKRVSIVSFAGPDSKGIKPQQGPRRWKEKSTNGMRAVADPSPHPPGRPQQQQLYVGLKKTLELDDDGNGNKWRAHEYTPLLPSDDGTNKLVPAEISLRVEFKEDEPPSSSSMMLLSSSLKRSRTGAPKDGPKTAPSEVWGHMTRLHVKVIPKDGSKRKKPYYKGMYTICHHCDQVFNADPDHGTHNLNNHLKSCKCNCTQWQSH